MKRKSHELVLGEHFPRQIFRETLAFCYFMLKQRPSRPA